MSESNGQLHEPDKPDELEKVLTRYLDLADPHRQRPRTSTEQAEFEKLLAKLPALKKRYGFGFYQDEYWRLIRARNPIPRHR